MMMENRIYTKNAFFFFNFLIFFLFSTQNAIPHGDRFLPPLPARFHSRTHISRVQYTLFPAFFINFYFAPANFRACYRGYRAAFDKQTKNARKCSKCIAPIEVSHRVHPQPQSNRMKITYALVSAIVISAGGGENTMHVRESARLSTRHHRDEADLLERGDSGTTTRPSTRA
jgi:hypothetical protein